MKRGFLFNTAVLLCMFSAVSLLAAQDSSKSSTSGSSNVTTSDSSKLSTAGATKLTADDADSGVQTKQLLQFALSNPEYPATPGDVYQLAYVAGTVIVSSTLVLDASYVLKVNNLGVLDARGKTFLQLKSQVENLVSKNYPLSGVQFSLTSPGFFKILVKGEVSRADLMNAHGLTRVSDLIGKKTTRGSIRNVLVTSAAGKSAEYDIFNAQRTGNLKENPFVKPGDVITIQIAERRVSLSGEVNRPGAYQMLSGEPSSALIEAYGDGFKYSADKSLIYVTRTKTDSDIPGLKYTFTYEEFCAFPLIDGDSVGVSSLAEKRKVVFFEGAIRTLETVETDDDTDVVQEGSGKFGYRFYEGEKLSSAVRSLRSRFMMNADLKSVSVIRKGVRTPVDCEGFLYRNDFSKDIVLENGDDIIVPFRQYFVIVSGAVKNPGKYAYVPDRDYQYYIDIAGGIDDTANNGRGIRLRDLSGNKLSANENIPAEALIHVPANRLLYYVNQYMSVVTLLISIISLVIAII